MATITDTKPTTDSKKWTRLLGFFALSFITLGVGGWLTSLGMDGWYRTLRLPTWQPPGWVFSPVWFSIMSLLAVATWLMWENAPSAASRRTPTVLYAFQLLANMTWSLLFFALHSPESALGCILVLDLLLLGMIVSYSRISALAGLLRSGHGL